MNDWRRRARERLSLWGSRLMELRGVRVESLEAAMWLSALGLFMLFAFRVPFKVMDYMRADLPRGAWMMLTGALFLLSFIGYVEDNIKMRRAGAFLSFVFWLISGLCLFRLAPYAACLHIFLGAIWDWVWTWMKQEHTKRTVRRADVIVLTEEAKSGSRVVKMPKRV